MGLLVVGGRIIGSVLGEECVDDVTRRVILSPEARRMGFAWHQDRGGKLWWTLTLGA